MYYVLLLTALLLIGLELFTSLRNQRTFHRGKAGDLWNRIYRWRWLAGVPFAALSPFIGYPVGGGGSPSYQVVGFPLVVAMIDEAGRNYVGSLSFPFVVINAAIWYFVPHILLYLWSAADRTMR